MHNYSENSLSYQLLNRFCKRVILGDFQPDDESARYIVDNMIDIWMPKIKDVKLSVNLMIHLEGFSKEQMDISRNELADLFTKYELDYTEDRGFGFDLDLEAFLMKSEHFNLDSIDKLLFKSSEYHLAQLNEESRLYREAVFKFIQNFESWSRRFRKFVEDEYAISY